MSGTPPTSSNVLIWPKRLLSADDLRRHLNGQREVVLLPKTIVTPLAADELKSKGLRVSWQVPGAAETTYEKQGTWIYAQEKAEPLVTAVVSALERDGVKLAVLSGDARLLAQAVLGEKYLGGILFAGDSALACCIANKIAGIRAAAVANAMQVAKAKKSFGANWFAIDMPGRTFFELRQTLRAIVTSGGPCPEGVVRILTELDGHAHR